MNKTNIVVKGVNYEKITREVKMSVDTFNHYNRSIDEVVSFLQKYPTASGYILDVLDDIITIKRVTMEEETDREYECRVKNEEKFIMLRRKQYEEMKKEF